jgi:branched-chain amino acid transport system ATP-binding protein
VSPALHTLAARAEPDAPLLQVRGLRKAFGGVVAVDGVDLEVGAGELLALIGPNGAGKSTCFNMINGQLAPDAGSVRLDGREIAGIGPRRVWRLGVGRTFQVAATWGSMTVIENVQLAVHARQGTLRRLWPRASSMHREESLALLEAVGLSARAEEPAAALAYGDVKALELAIALAGAPRLLLMDEPTAGMAPAERGALMQRVKGLARERGLGVLFTEHSMDVVFAHADRILVLARGEPIAQGAPQAIRDDPRVAEVYFGSGRLAARWQ